MSIVRSADSLAILRKAYEGNGELQTTSIKVRKSQKEMIDELANQSGESQASVLRAIIDEWCEMKLARGI
jgi:hypothetical protein